MYKIATTNRFDHELRLCLRRGLSLQKYIEVVELLRTDGKLPKTYKPHKLKGEYKGYWECHIMPDWLLIWDQNDKELTLTMMHTGTHSDLF